jgi:pilus assembly protein Flp/PilA
MAPKGPRFYPDASVFLGRLGVNTDSSMVQPMIPSIQGAPRPMEHIFQRLMIWKDQRGQDLIEYALMAGFVAVAAGAAFPPVADTISQIFSKVQSVMSSANAS